ncbi:HEPN domain-containing protein [Sporosarcina sp. SG10008]|uniref:HEPN domain-containing protein n=1 Tax=Sporosarcina sp. SG10008 TaxID=3373103 RepID=UPI0037DC6556
MSIDIQILIDKHLDKRDIEEIIYSVGFKKERNDNRYYWFNGDFISIRGCWFSFAYDVESFYGDDSKIIRTVCSTTTNAGRSYGDFQMQIDIIKKFEEAFGGIVYSDGEIGYYENDFPNLSRTEIACGYAYITFERNLAMAEQLMEEVDSAKLLEYQKLGILPTFEKSLLRNNTLVPFLVSIMESFLRMFLQNYISSNEEAENLIFKRKEKLSYAVVKELLNNEKNIIEVEMENYSFQSFNSANKAYTHFIGIDLFKDIFSHKMMIDGQELSMISILSELLEKRHKLIHEAELDFSLDKQQMEKYYDCLVLLGETFKRVFKEKKNIRIDLENQL